MNSLQEIYMEDLHTLGRMPRYRFEYRGVPNYQDEWIDRSIATQRPPNPLDLFIATQSLPNEILLSRTIGNIHMGRVLVPAVLNHAQARINYGTGTTTTLALARNRPTSIIYIIPLYRYCIRIIYLYLLTCMVRAFTRLHDARIQYLATAVGTSLLVLVP